MPGFEEYDVEADESRLEALFKTYADRSGAALRNLSWQRDLVYGTEPDARFDLVEAEPAEGPIVIFFHGGWWRSGRKEDRAFLAPSLVSAGVHFANAEYPLAPATSLPDIASCAINAVRIVVETLADRGKSGPIILAGNSAGAHLAMQCASVSALTAAGVVPQRLHGVVAVSGLYDLAPLLTLPPNSWLNLEAEAAERLSPINADYPNTARLRLYVGADEPPGFLWQSERLMAKARGFADRRSEILEGEDHLGIIARIPDLALDLIAE